MSDLLDPSALYMYYLRHTFKDEEGGRPEMISHYGVQVAHAVGERFAGIPISACYGTDRMRTHETLARIIMAAKLNVPQATKTASLTGLPMDLWMRHSDKGHDLQVMRKHHPQFIADAGAVIKNVFSDIFHAEGLGKVILLVGHSPCAELTAEVLTGKEIEPLKPCEGFLLKANREGIFTFEEEIRHNS